MPASEAERTLSRWVVVVDDEPVQRLLTRDAAERVCAGRAAVLDATDGAQALDILSRLDAAGVFLVVDRHMPGIDGEEVLRRAMDRGADGVLWTAMPIGVGDLPCLAKPTDVSRWGSLIASVVSAWLGKPAEALAVA